MPGFRLRVAVVVSLVVLALGVIVMGVTARAYQSVLDGVARSIVDDGRVAFEQLRDSRAERIELALALLAGDEAIANAFGARDRARLLELSYPRFADLRDEFGISRLYFYEPDESGTVFLRAYLGPRALEPDSYGDASASRVLAQARENAGSASGLELGRTALSLRVTQAYRDATGTIIGYLGMAEQVDHYLEAISRLTGDEYALFVDKSRVDAEAWARLQEGDGHENTWDRYDDVLLVESTLTDTSALEDFEPGTAVDEPVYLGLSSEGDRVLATGAFPIRDSEGERVGEVLAQRDLTAVAATLRTVQLALVGAFVLLAVMASIALVVVIDRMILRRVDILASDVERMALSAAAGTWEGESDDKGEPRDEFDRLRRRLSGLMALVSDAIRDRRGGS